MHESYWSDWKHTSTCPALVSCLPAEQHPSACHVTCVSSGTPILLHEHTPDTNSASPRHQTCNKLHILNDLSCRHPGEIFLSVFSVVRSFSDPFILFLFCYAASFFFNQAFLHQSRLNALKFLSIVSTPQSCPDKFKFGKTREVQKNCLQSSETESYRGTSLRKAALKVSMSTGATIILKHKKFLTARTFIRAG